MTMIIGAIYIGLCLLLSLVATIVEKRMRRSVKTPAGGVHHPVTEATDTQLIAAQRGAGKYDGNSTAT